MLMRIIYTIRFNIDSVNTYYCVHDLSRSVSFINTI